MEPPRGAPFQLCNITNNSTRIFGYFALVFVIALSKVLKGVFIESELVGSGVVNRD